jgi:hypothetical protein
MTEVKPPEDDNKRIARRMKTLKSAKIVFLNQWSVIDCAVRDMSATGAKLVCAQAATVPNEFRLLMLSDNMMRNAKVVWRREDTLGIHFIGEAYPSPPRKY